MSYIDIAKRYADDILTGAIPACLYVRQACKRFVDDLDRDDIELNKKHAELWCEKLEKLPHVKGRWAKKRELLKLSPWQVFITVNLYGWHRLNGRRRFREAYIEVPRKNGKTFFIAGHGVGHLTWGAEYGAEVYCGATSEAQAWEVFRPARQMCEALPALRRKYNLEVNAKTLVRLDDLSRFAPVIGDPGDGASPSCGIVDEFHEHKNSNLVDTFQTGMGSRENPMLLQITTAGSDMGGPCYDKRGDVVHILSGAVEDDSVFGIIYTLDEDDAWDTIEAQIKANPNYGVSVDSEYLSGQLAQARRSATKQNSYKTKHLNLWVGAKSSWMNMLAYQACRRNGLQLDDQEGRRCVIALDLASKVDISSKAVLFPPDGRCGRYRAFVRHYLPESALEDGPNAERYRAWHADGWLVATPGNVTDFEYIENDIVEDRSRFEIAEVAYDPFQATQFAVHMFDEGFPMVEYGQTVKNLSDPMKQLEAEILSKNIEFEHDPVLFWMFGNVVARVDAKDNIFPRKERDQNKIDGVVALIIAIARCAVRQESNPYDERGIRTIEA